MNLKVSIDVVCLVKGASTLTFSCFSQMYLLYEVVYLLSREYKSKKSIRIRILRITKRINKA